MITLGNLTQFGRRYVRDGCTGKKSFSTYAEGEAEMGRLIKKNAHRPHLGVLAPYLCPRCGRYHLGHSKLRGEKS